MHEQRVAHLDLKPENILVTVTGSPRLHIIDFDVSVQVPEEDSYIEGYRGTEGWTVMLQNSMA
jgi:serine/threonine protein kinase